MKKRYLAMAMGIMMSLNMVICSGAQEVTASAAGEAAVEQTSEMTDGQNTQQAPEMQQTPQMPDGQAPDGQTPPDMPGSAENNEERVSGEITEITETEITIKVTKGGPSMNGAPMEKPEGSSEDGAPTEKPEGSSEDGAPTEKPEGSSEDGAPTEKPEGSSEDGAPMEKPEGSGEDGAPTGKPGDSARETETRTITITDATEIVLSEDKESLAEGDEVVITLNDDGTAARIEEGSIEDMGSFGGPMNGKGGPGEGGPMNGKGGPGEGGPMNGQGGPGGEGGQMEGQGGPGEGGPMGGQGGPGGQSQGVDEYTAVTTYTEDAEVTGQTIESTGTDENAVLVQGGEVSVSGSEISRESSDSSGGDNASFYGVGAALLTTDGTLYVTDSDIDTEASGGAGVFAYGDGTAYVADTEIDTELGASGGIHAAGGGTLYAWDLDVETSGGSSAAIRSDRGGGTMVVDGGTYTSNGSGSPAIYCTADISVNNAELTATGSEAICIEGLNTIRLYDCTLTGNMPDQDQNDTTWNVIVYQSMSGDSELGNGTFEMTGGTLTAENGGMFYTTNTESTITLNNVEIVPAENNLYFLKVTGNSNARGWGETGSNGADCLFTAITQEMEGDVIWDSISSLNFYMTENSVLTGAVIDDESNAGNGGDGTAVMTIDASSKWIVTGDSVLTELHNAGTITDEEGLTVSVVGTDGTVYVEGESEYTITVDTYSEDADVTGASVPSAWENYAVEKPAQLA